jgi:hypothetical protein
MSKLATTSSIVGLVCLLTGVACSSKPNVDSVAVGQQVQVTKDDGGVVVGKLAAKDATTVKISTSHAVREIPRAKISDVQVVDAKTPVTLPPAAKFREYTVQEGTPLAVKLTTAVSSETSHVEDVVEGELAESVKVDGAVVVPAGSAIRGQVAAAQPSGKVKGLASLLLRFTSLTASGPGDHYQIAAQWSRQAQPTKTEDAKKIGIGAGAGAVIGAIVGGGKGAAIGAAAGGGAGTGVVLATSGKEVTLSSGALITITLDRDLDVKVPVK